MADYKRGKVYVGLSGGVDSAVSAALLKKDGYEVTGVFIKIQISGYPCPAAKDRIDAMRVAAHLKISFIEVDLSKEYEREVLKPSINEYARGRTPNPDTLCNEKIKFGVFFNFCRSRRADFIATGHYARVTSDHILLLAGIDSNKDQSYFLWMVPEGILQYVLFPIGCMRKSEVRAYAKKIGLPNAGRKDSQGLCFLGDISMGDMIKREISQSRGPVLSEAGEVIGEHEGAAFYTLGQRHGFSILSSVNHGKPNYVVAKNVENNTITISEAHIPRHFTRTKIDLSETNWIGDVSGALVSARFRYRQKLIPASLENGLRSVILHEPHYVPLGQSLVLYDGERCLGGGIANNVTLQQ